MVTFSATDSATTTDFGSPTTLRVLDLEDTSAYASLMSHAARHRLPVFLNLKDDSCAGHSSLDWGDGELFQEIL
jgi:hypothetical protein